MVVAMAMAMAMARGRDPGGGGHRFAGGEAVVDEFVGGGGDAARCDDEYDDVVSILDPRRLVLLGLVRGHGTQEFLDR